MTILQPNVRPVQAFRVSGASESSQTINIHSRLDNKTGQQVVLWKDVLQVFEHAKYISDGSMTIPFLADDDFEELVPLRISHRPGAVLNVVVESANEERLTPANISSGAPRSPQQLVSPAPTVATPIPPVSSPTSTVVPSTSAVVSAQAAASPSPSPTPPVISPAPVSTSLAPIAVSEASAVVPPTLVLATPVTAPPPITISIPITSNHVAPISAAAPHSPKAIANNATLQKQLTMAFSTEAQRLSMIGTLNVPPAALSEKEELTRAGQVLKTFLENPTQLRNFFRSDIMDAVRTLVRAGSVAVQQVVAGAYAVISAENEDLIATEEGMESLVYLINATDIVTQIYALKGMCNLLYLSYNANLAMKVGTAAPYVKHMASTDWEVQAYAVGCLLNFARNATTANDVSDSGVLERLIPLVNSSYAQVQEFAAGALYNFMNHGSAIQKIVNAGAIPVLVRALNPNSKPAVLSFCAAAIAQIAVESSNRKKLISTESGLVAKLVGYLDTTRSQLACDAAFALHKLSLEGSVPQTIVQSGGLTPLHRMVQSTSEAMIASGLNCVREMSYQGSAKEPIINAGFINPLSDLMNYAVPEIAIAAVSIIHNLADSDGHRKAIVDAGVADRCFVLLPTSPVAVQEEMTALISRLTECDSLKPVLHKKQILEALLPVSTCTHSMVNVNISLCIVNLCNDPREIKPFLKVWDSPLLKVWDTPSGGMRTYLIRCITSVDRTEQRQGLKILRYIFSGKNTDLKKRIRKTSTLKTRVASLAEYPKAQANMSTGDGANLLGVDMMEVMTDAQGVLKCFK
ncbi:Vacuolar protein 8 [Mortierella polycephala]|uniref:Vacuolar protein 8 n=1 Tax=Mortierella polycephala TaxID=41804 RepID=A0A9P6U7D9_9FUNG|nr:Vacuolar protein 8 [Mortierella polycephala]